MSIRHTKFDLDPPSSPENVLKQVLADFGSKNDEVPELLSKFITLLGNEKEGLKALKVCTKEFSIWEKGIPELNGRTRTVDDLEKFLFSLDRNVIAIQGPEPDPSSASRAVIQGVADPRPKLKTFKGPDPSSTSKSVILGAVETSKGPSHPSSSKANLEKSKGPDNPSTSIKATHVAVGETSVPPADPKTLKVKIYMGTGWDIDFPKLKSPPSLFVNLGICFEKEKQLEIHGGEGQKKTNVEKKTKTPCWGEEIEFPISSLKGAKLIVEVYHKHKLGKLFEDKFAGEFCILVSALKPGIQVIPLSYKEKKPCRSARLLVRIMLY